MLTVIRNDSATDVNRLGVASGHLKAAILHINNEAQRHIPASRSDRGDIEAFRLIVRAISDIIDALDSTRRASAEKFAAHPAVHGRKQTHHSHGTLKYNRAM